MSTLQKILVVIVVVIAVGFGIYQNHRLSKLKGLASQALQQHQQEQTLELSNKVHALERELAFATNRAPSTQASASPRATNEALRLRGEVGRLRSEKASIASSNAISKVTANPESRKLLRDQQKMGMTYIYKGFRARANLTVEQADKLNDLLADYIMDNVDRVTEALRDKPGTAELNQMFAAEDTALQERIKDLIGEEGLTQFRDYSTTLLATITAEQFKGMLSGDDEAKQSKSKLLAQAIQEESKAALATAGLPEDYQTIPILNLKNIASEEEGNRSVKLLEDIYQRVATRGITFLSPEELKKFDDYRATGVQNSRAAIMLNRTIMAPISQ